MNDDNLYSPLPASDDSNSENINLGQININGQSFGNLDQLPPQYRDQIKEALNRLGSNPQMASLINQFASMAKQTRQNGIGVTTVKTGDISSFKELLKGQLSGENTKITPEQRAQFKNMLLANSQAAKHSNIIEQPAVSMGSTTPMFDIKNPKPALQPFSSSNNPHVKNDGWRKMIWVAVGLLILGYFGYKYGWFN